MRCMARASCHNRARSAFGRDDLERDRRRHVDARVLAIERLRQIQRLTQDMGVNLAGVEVILGLLDRLEQAQEERDAILQRSQEVEARIREYLRRSGGKFP